MPVLLNPEPRFVILHAPLGPNDPPNDDRMHTLQLQPGINDVADSEWAKVKDHHAVKKFLDAGVLEVIDVKGVTHSLEGAKPREAIKMAQQTVDIEMLRRWKAKEKNRPEVAKAIAEQLKKLEE